MGFKVSMDDFGSGYSSLNLLKKLPVDVLKMDKGFLDTEEIKGNDEVVIKSIIDMAKKMITEETKNAIIQVYGDFDVFLNSCIESMVKENKE